MDQNTTGATTVAAAAAADSDSTVTSIEENTENFCDNPTRDILADGVISVFKSTADQLQERVRTTREAQQELHRMLDGLSAKLRAIQKAQETPPVFEEYVRKLISVKHKVTVMYNVLNTTQERLNRVYRQVENETTRRKVMLDSVQRDDSLPAGGATNNSLADATL